MAASVVWFGRDLRLADNPALSMAAGQGGPIVPVYIHSPQDEGAWPIGAASRWWLHRSLRSLDAALQRRGSRLILRHGAATEALCRLAGETGAATVFRSRVYDPALMECEARAAADLGRLGVKLRTTEASLLTEPGSVVTTAGDPYQVFTPFYRAVQRTMPPQAPLPEPARMEAPAVWPESVPMEALSLEPEPDWTGGIRSAWRPGEEGAHDRLVRFAARGLEAYHEARDLPGGDGVSRLSPHLHFGEISPAQVWQAVDGLPGAEPFLRQLMWREFAHHLLFSFPHTPTAPLRREFNSFPWGDDREGFRAWTRGRTGYPIVDAGMRELWATGWMHNRVRMIAASFLTKDLLVPWRQGARWFWDTLVDADLANNTLGWQWTAGCGADAAPYFRVFNPVTQAARYDPDGEYVRRWVPELSRLPDLWIHRPWEAPRAMLEEAGVTLGVTYPHRIVDHAMARDRALRAYEQTRRQK